MTTQLSDFKHDKKNFRFQPSALKGFSLTHQLQALSELREAAYKGNWTTVQSLGFDCLGKAYAGIQALRIEHGQYFAAKSKKIEEHGIYIAMKKLLENKKYEEIVAHFKERLSISNPDLLGRILDSLEAIKRGDNSDIPLFRTKRGGSKTIENKHSAKESLEKSLMAMAHRGLLAISYSQYQLTFSSSNNQLQTKETSQKKLQLLLNESNSFEKQLRNFQKDIFLALMKCDPLASLPAVNALISFIESTLPRFASIQALAYKEMQKLYSSGNQFSQLEKLGKLTARAGNISREALASHIAAYRIIVNLHKNTLTSETKLLLNKTELMAFDAKLPNGKNVSFADIANSHEDELIEIGGVVQSVDSKREDSEKLIGRAVLREPSSGKEIQVATPYAHLSHMGLTENSYCIVNGYYKRNSKLLLGKAGIEIQKFSLNDLAGAAWRFAFIKYADIYYQCWRNQANMMFSLGPHILSEEYAQSGAQGAGELIYPPFFR